MQIQSHIILGETMAAVAEFAEYLRDSGRQASLLLLNFLLRTIQYI